MISKLAKTIAHFFVKQNIAESKNEAIYAYGMELLLSDVLNGLLAFIIALVSGTVFPTLLFFTVFMILRRFSGGYHADTHYGCILTMEGGGFLFNTKVTSDNIMSGYCALVTQQGLKLYFIEGIDADLFSDGILGNLSTVGELLGTYDIGDVLDYHELTLRVSKSKVSLWDGNNTIIDNYELPYDTEGYGFGPITSHTSHACSQISYFTFSNIEMLVTSES